ncbi:uncharacterized protein LOC116935538 isoform X2 [Daphnia magna]|uniref:uncharacterized protein LOC116935538 isoform X2 n=1 Tax=Daphnia magna TaxID=35525 RepID=UPI001E1BBFEB|nr:uncharacterized protein LOC116935538 isoform X2 [Daphnia magna]
MDLSTSKPCHSLVDEEPSSSEHSPQLVSELQKEIEKLTAQLEKMNAEYVSLKKEFAMYCNRPITSHFFSKCQNSDRWMRVYTSLSTAKSFEILFKAIQSGIPENNSFKLCKRQQLFLTLVKLSHNPADIDLAFRFDISEWTVSRYFHSWVDCIYYKLKTHVLIWPLLSQLQVAMPMCFRRHYPNTVSIMDCFETQIQIPNDRNDQAATYSTYKRYAGRKSDQFIVRHSGYIDNLKAGDEVLADMGFEVAEEIGLRGAKLITPAFKRAAQLTQLETEISRQVSNVRIHIEREIGCMRMKFDIMRGPVIMYNLNTFQDNVCFYDEIVAVCCILSNLNPSIIPFE